MSLCLAFPIARAQSVAGTVATVVVVAGNVTDSNGRPLAGANVTLPDHGKSEAADASGAFSISGVPIGPQRVLIRNVGFTPLDTTITVSVNKRETYTLVLTRIEQLDSVRVFASRGGRGSGYEAFEERRRLGFGAFFDSTLVRSNEHRELQDLLRTVRSVNIVQAPECTAKNCRFNPPRGMRVALNGARRCLMSVVLDGRTVAAGNENDYEKAFDLRSIPLHLLQAVEVYSGPAQIPHEVSGLNTSCGVIVLWSKRP